MLALRKRAVRLMEGRRPIDRAGLDRAAQQAFLALAAVLFVTKCVITIGFRWPAYGEDFRGTVWRFGADVLAGRAPYPAPDAHALLLQSNPAVYPPGVLAFAVPFSLLPVGVAVVVWDLCMLVCLGAALRLVGVRDYRIYLVALLSMPMTSSLLLGQIDGLLALLCALTWKYRERLIPVSLAVAAAIAVKLFLWPLAVWLWMRGRRKAAVLGVLGAAAITFAAWAAIGFSGLRHYPRLLAADSDAFQVRGFSVVATGLRAGLSSGPARLVALTIMLLLLLAAWQLSRTGCPERAFAAAVAAGIFSSPIVWIHSLVIFFVAFAIIRPRYSTVWLLPLLLWVVGGEPPSTARFVAGQVVICVLIAVALLPLGQLGRTRVFARAAAHEPA